MRNIDALRAHLHAGQAIPALPLALGRNRKWSERRQRAVLRYYMDAGAGGIAVAVHSTQFEIRDRKHGLHEPILTLAAETVHAWKSANDSAAPSRSGLRPDHQSKSGHRPDLLSIKRPFAMIAGVCGQTPQAVREAELAAERGYHAALLSLAAWKTEPERDIIRHCRTIARTLPLIGFYLQPAVGGRVLSYRFWREFAAIPDVVAIKIAPFNRYQTLDVVRAVIDAERDDVALYTGNDDNIIGDLITPFEYGGKKRFIAGGLLGQWGVWTSRAVELLDEIKRARRHARLDADFLTRNAALTDANAAVFDAANGFAGCIPGIHEILRRQGIFETTACLNPHETLSRGQAAELDRVCRAYPWLTDDEFVASNLSRWLA